MAFEGYPKHVSTGAANLFVYDLNDRRVNRITDATEDDAFRTPRLSPSGRELAAFEVFGHPLTGARLVTIDTTTRQLRPLVNFRPELKVAWIPKDLAWSPTGRALAFIQGGYVNVVASDGTGLRRIAPLPESSLYDRITWSPRGDRIGFSRSEYVYSVAPDGSDLKRVAAGRVVSWTTWMPAISPH